MIQIAEFEQLMADVASGSEEAVWRLAETYTPYIIRAVRLSLSPRLRSKIDSMDFAQTLWKSILLRRADLARLTTPEKLIAYLARATKNKVVDQVRYYAAQQRNFQREEPLEPYIAEPACRIKTSNALYARDPTPSASAGLRERWQQIIAKSSPRDRRILQLRLKGLTFDDIGTELQINCATARRAMERLIEQLSQ